MGLDGDRMDRQQAALHVEERVRLVPGRLHFPALDVGQFVQHLSTERSHPDQIGIAEPGRSRRTVKASRA